MKKTSPIVRVGVAVIIKRAGKILLGKRIGSHGKGTWSFPGGHLEYGEDIAACARRETAEETGIRIKNIFVAAVTNDHFKKEGKHYVTLFVVADHASGRVTLKEPAKCERWDWFSLEKLPSPLFLPIRNLRRQSLLTGL